MGFADDAFLVGFVGRLTPQKNPYRLIEAFELIAQRHPNARLVIVGNGVLQSSIEDKLKQKNLTDRVRLFTNTNARDIMPGFDCLLCSSDYEAFSLIFLEALNAGVPIVTPPVGGAEQAIIPHRTGIITSDFSAHSLASGVCALAQRNDQARQEMSEHCRTHARLFDCRSMAQATRALYAATIA